MKDIKKNIPNILTIARIVLTFIIVILGITNHIYTAIILTIIAALTDLFDGLIARKYNLETTIGAKLDAVADKIFAIGLIACIVTKYKILIILLLLEILLAGMNLYFHLKTNKTESLIVGKFKTWLLFLTVIFGIITIFVPKLNIILNGFSYATINLQILSIISYTLNFYNNINKKEITIEDNEAHQEIMNDLEETIVVDDLKELINENEIYNYDDNENI